MVPENLLDGPPVVYELYNRLGFVLRGVVLIASGQLQQSVTNTGKVSGGPYGAMCSEVDDLQ